MCGLGYINKHSVLLISCGLGYINNHSELLISLSTAKNRPVVGKQLMVLISCPDQKVQHPMRSDLI